jgi:pre-mRNA-splicing factor CWC22
MADTAILQSAVRVPTPPPGFSLGPSSMRKRSPPSRSPSPRRERPPPQRQDRGDHDLSERDARERPPTQRYDRGGHEAPEKDARERELEERLRPKHRVETSSKPLTAEEKQALAKAEYQKLLTMRSGGTYIPPARLRELQAQISDKKSVEYQRMAWEALKKSITGLINKANESVLKFIVPELFTENLVRGRGLFCRSIMKAQAASLPFTPIYAAMAAIVNTKLPQVGELLLKRLVIQFRKAFKRNDKAVCLSSTTFIAHLCNHLVADEVIAAEILLLLLHKPTDDSVEIAVGFAREVGHHLEEMNPAIANAVFDQFRSILHESDVEKRTQYMIEVLFQVRKDRYKDNPSIKDELDLVEEEDQITHSVKLDDPNIEVQDGLNIFKYDPEWEEHEEAYRKLKAEILGEGSDDEDEDADTEESSDDEEAEKERQIEIKDQTNTDLVNLRRTIYLTIMSSLDFESAVHSLMKVQLPPGQESELVSMIIECAAQEKTYSKFYGLVSERFAKLNRLWLDLFEQSFAQTYDTIHRRETNQLRNVARLFGHMLSTDAVGWHIFSVVHLNEDETTSSSRIFIKILFQDLAEALGMPTLQGRLKDEILRPSFSGIFPTHEPRNTRFSINYFTSIGMGVLTEEMREHLKNLPKPALPALPVPKNDVVSESESVSSYSSYSSYTTSRSYSASRSPERNRRGKEVVRGVDRERYRGRGSPTMTVSRSRSPPREKQARRARSYSSTRSPSPAPPRGARRRSASYSASPTPLRRRPRSISSTPPQKNGVVNRRRDSYLQSRSPPRFSKTNGRDRDLSTSFSPPPRRRQRSLSDSRSPPGRRGRRNTSSEGSMSRSPPAKRGARRISRSPIRRRSPSYERGGKGMNNRVGGEARALNRA